MVNWIKITNHFFVLANSYKKIAKSFFEVLTFYFFVITLDHLMKQMVLKNMSIYIY